MVKSYGISVYTKSMKVIILGAGASFHAGYPLASQMGKSLVAWIEILPADHHFRTVNRQIEERYGSLDNFESILADLMTPSQDSQRTEFETLRPYILGDLQEALRQQFEMIRSRPVALYERLVKLIQPGDIVITFNYDLAIEKALQEAGLWRISTGYGFEIEDEQPPSPVEVLKLHGSMNWRALLFEGRRRGGFIGNGTSLGQRPVLFFRPDLEYLGYGSFVDPRCASLTAAASIPAMILPALPKRFYFETSFGREWEEFWSALWDRAEQAIEAASEIAVIGYSLPIADEAARNLLLNTKNRSVPLAISCGSSSEGIRDEFAKNGFSAVEPAPRTFEEYLAAKEAAKSHSGK
jgi:hypothetical protein